jgi:hypothetical protein
MNDYTCACGYEARTAEDLGDHIGEIGEMVIPPDDIARDSQVHAEAARDERGAIGPDPAGWRCPCGFTFGTPAGLDQHLLAMFAEPAAAGPVHRPPDQGPIGLARRRTPPVQLAPGAPLLRGMLREWRIQARTVNRWQAGRGQGGRADALND